MWVETGSVRQSYTYPLHPSLSPRDHLVLSSLNS
jgi:hypothetical protein